MCGFAGFTGYLADGDAVLERMMNKIIHRGPDSAGNTLMIKLTWASDDFLSLTLITEASLCLTRIRR